MIAKTYKGVYALAGPVYIGQTHSFVRVGKIVIAYDVRDRVYSVYALGAGNKHEWVTTIERACMALDSTADYAGEWGGLADSMFGEKRSTTGYDRLDYSAGQERFSVTLQPDGSYTVVIKMADADAGKITCIVGHPVRATI